MVARSFHDDAALVFHMPFVIFKDGLAVVVTEFGYRKEVLPLHVREEVGLSGLWR